MKKLLKSKTLYVFLGLAVVVIAISGFLSRINDFNSAMEEYSGGYDIEMPENFELPVVTDEFEPEQKPVVVEEKEEQEQEQEQDALPVSVTVKPVAISLPLQGELLNEHSEGELVYSKTMEDWRTHNGIDIAADVGTAVKAAADGVVTKTGYDGLYGYCVTIMHDGFETKYCGMQESNIVEENTQVKCGDVIGGVGVTAEIESADTPHLHFELIKEEKSVNPLIYVEN